MFAVIHYGMFRGEDIFTQQTAEQVQSFTVCSGINAKPVKEFLQKAQIGDYTALPNIGGGRKYLIIIRTA